MVKSAARIFASAGFICYEMNQNNFPINLQGFLKLQGFLFASG